MCSISGLRVFPYSKRSFFNRINLIEGFLKRIEPLASLCRVSKAKFAPFHCPIDKCYAKIGACHATLFITAAQIKDMDFLQVILWPKV